jgi:transcriptional regulator with XRE-family HTH domain
VKLYDIMQEKNYGVRALAREAGVSTATINWILNGKSGGPYFAGPNSRRKICKVLGVRDTASVDEFAAAVEYYKREREVKEKAKVNSAYDSLMLMDLTGGG